MSRLALFGYLLSRIRASREKVYDPKFCEDSECDNTVDWDLVSRIRSDVCRKQSTGPLIPTRGTSCSRTNLTRTFDLDITPLVHVQETQTRPNDELAFPFLRKIANGVFFVCRAGL